MSKKDEPGKGPTGSAGPGGNRPHATLDLKAKDVTPPSDKKETATGSDKGPVTPSDKAPVGKPAEGPKAAAPGNVANASGPAPANDKGTASAKAPLHAQAPLNGRPPTNDKAPPHGARPSGYGGFFTHLAAGIVGGIFALLAADMLASQLGLDYGGDKAATAALEQRIASLEQARKEGAPTLATDQRLKAAEDKIGKLEALSPTVDDIAKRQGQIESGLQAVDAKVAKAPGQDVAARVAKLEDQLATLSAAAEQDPQSGRLPQLAAITGKVADLEATVAHQLDALRKSVNDEIDTRLMVASETSEAAKAGTQRLDREVAGIKADNAQIASELNALKAESDRAATMVKTTADSLSSLRSEIEARLASFAKPTDVAAAVSPLSDMITALQKDVSGVVESEGNRKTTAQRIVLSLELTDLKRAIDRGTGYAAELAHIRKLSDGTLDLAPLDRFAETGAPTLADLRKDFKSVAFKIIEADQTPADGSIMDRLLAGARSVVRVRKVSHSPDDKSTEAVVARMEAALNANELGDVLKEAKTLPEPAQKAAQDFLAKVEARAAVDNALEAVEAQLKTALVAPSGATDASQR